MKDTHIKVCGLTRPEDMEALSGLGVHYGGMIFHAPSPRFIEGRTDPAGIKRIAGIRKVGVFVNAAPDYIYRQAEVYGLDMVQLHGEETPEYCAIIRRHLPVIKALRLKSEQDLEATARYEGACDYLLFDTPGPLYGGNGTLFNWALLEHYQGSTPFFLSGGIGPEAAEKLSSWKHPACHAIDLNSRFEQSPGVKNIDLLKQFIWDLNIS
ncbi:phosphoribosylanthranilate isomerase [Compostibacter hankyongensis]|uniref:N-(5'-phosphoribosyl)anthranilate isomerase n=1 Tax=Compostibacter hankyongensis TaxID=1007089 RepID=A0ABP8FX38_9BACT